MNAEAGGEESRREMTFLLAGPERRLLRAIARALPPWLNSDHLTIIGVIGAVGVAVAYALSPFDPGWLWLATGMLVVNWFGDSLDGTVARVRKHERPRYGYYIDHAVDALTTTLIAGGLGLSPFVSLWVSLVVVIVYLMLSINVYLESAVYGIFNISYGRFGPTEARIILALVNTALYFAVVHGLSPAAILGVADPFVCGLAAVMFLVLVVRFARNLRRLGEREPLERPRPKVAAGGSSINR